MAVETWKRQGRYGGDGQRGYGRGVGPAESEVGVCYVLVWVPVQNGRGG